MIAFFQLIVETNLSEPQLAARLLKVLRTHPDASPEFWGDSAAFVDRPFELSSIEAALAERRPGGLVPHLRRIREPAYRAKFFPDETRTISALEIEGSRTQSADEVKKFVGAFSELAGTVETDFGHFDLRFDAQEPATWMQSSGSYLHLNFFRKNGPEMIFARTFFSRRIVGLMGGVDVLRAAADDGGELVILGNGVHQLDVVASPWTSDAAKLKSAQLRAMYVLRRSGIFAEAVSSWRFVPGRNWRPPVER